MWLVGLLPAAVAVKKRKGKLERERRKKNEGENRSRSSVIEKSNSREENVIVALLSKPVYFLFLLVFDDFALSLCLASEKHTWHTITGRK